MRFRAWLVVLTGLLLITLTACSAAPAQPLQFNPAPRRAGEVSMYDLKDRNGAPLGTAVWTWQEGPGRGEWTQGYELSINGRSDRGEVVMGQDLHPVGSWRQVGGQRFATTYAADAVTIVTTAADGKKTTKTLKPAADGIDNDQSLQVQRALPLAEGYATRYTDVIPTTGLTAPVRLSVTGAETITVPAGIYPTWHTILDYGSGKHDAWYGQQVPYPLVKYVNQASGASFELWSITGSEGAAAPAVQPEPPPTVPSGPPPFNLPFILSSVLFQYPLMIFFPLILGWWIRRRYRVGWGIFWAGAATFVLSQIVHIPLNYVLGLLGGGRGVALWPLPAMALVAGLSAALCEEGARWIVLTFFLKQVRRWDQGLQYGAGHGGIEAILFGALALASFVSMIVLRALDPAVLNLSGASAQQAQAQMAQYWATPWHMSVLAGLERVFAITLQIALALLVVRSVARRQPLYFLAAIGLHTAADFWAVWGARTIGALWMEVGVAILTAFALWLILRLKEPPPRPEPVPGPTPVITADDLTPLTLSAEDLARRIESSKYE
jgi:uncharacterized membrane protein YhfC